MSDLRFLPWLQTGLSRAATGSGGRADALAAVTVGGDSFERPLELAGPGDVASIDPGVWGVRFPSDGADDAEETFLVSIEIHAADLPWRLSRASADGQGQPAPWMVLVVVELGEGVELLDGVGTALARLVLAPAAQPSTQLPDLRHRSTWAHVQSTLSAADVVARPTDPGIVARLLCPRDLAPNRRYLAAVVPATAEGVAGGLGLAAAPPTITADAWALDDPNLDAGGITLPVYTHWTFGTGPMGDFESLTSLIRGNPLGPRTGVADLDVSRPGPSIPAAEKPVSVDYRGALRAPDITSKPWNEDHRQRFQQRLRTVLDHSVDRPAVAGDTPAGYRPRRDDPVVAPPLYGELAAGLRKVPDPLADNDDTLAWGADLNLDPALRAAAGLGAEAVRRRAADYVAAAWRHLADAPAAVAATNRAIFGAAVSQRLAQTVADADDTTVLAVTNRLPVARRARVEAGLPDGMADPVVARITRSSAVVGRRFSDGLAAATTTRDDLRPDSLSVSMTAAHRAASLGDASVRVVADFALFTGVASALTHHYVLTSGPSASAAATSGPSVQPLEGFRIPRRPQVLRSTTSTADVADQIRQQLDPSRAVAADLADRMPQAGGPLTDTPAPVPLVVELDFPDAIVDPIVAQGQHFVLPGLDDFVPNSAALAVVEPVHVAAALAGANHELLRELLWHGLPVDLRQTPIRRYWETGDPTDRDIPPIAEWKGRLSQVTLAGQSPGGPSVMVVRATLFRRYPAARIHLVGGTWDGSDLRGDPSRMVDPIFEGRLDPSTRYAAFDFPLKVLVGDLTARRRTTATAGWFLAFEEAPSAPRFRPLSSRRANSAAHAAAAYQPPFRGLIHVSELVGGP